MPEGDTIFKLARQLRAVLVDQPILELVVPRGQVQLPTQCTISGVDPVGKHLLFRFEAAGDGGSPMRIMRIHLGMHGRWSYRRDGGWRRNERHVLLVTPAHQVVCRKPAQVALYRDDTSVRRGIIGQLGPDLLGEAPDLDEVVRRARSPRRRRMTVAELLLDQRVAAGLGNAYKSELVFMAGLDPWAPVEALDAPTLRALFEHAIKLLRHNLGPGKRVTAIGRIASGARPRGGLRHWVYRRAGRPCPRCSTLIRSRLQGSAARMTYWCPRCQPSQRDGSDA